MKKPTTDLWLVLMHWLTVGAVLLSAATGLRIASDDPEAVVTRWISPVLLEGSVHNLHILSGLTLLSVAAAYLGYLIHAQLFKHLRVPPMPGSRLNARVAWKRRNVRIHQLQFVLLTLLGLTGVLLYVDWQPPAGTPAAWLLNTHLALAWALLAITVLHVICQYKFGATAGRRGTERIRNGVDWLLKMLRPRAEGWGDGSTLRVHPLTAIVALGAGAAACGGLVALDGMAHERVQVVAVGPDGSPTLDGIANDAVWQDLRAGRVLTRAGVNLPAGQSLVEVKAAHDGEHVYLVFRWQDRTRSLKHLPLQKTAEGWRLVHEEYDIEDEDVFYEDKFAVLLASSPEAGPKTAHLGPKPLADHPAPLSGRGLHYTNDGTVADMWQWKSVRSEPLGFLDDDSFGPPAEPKPEEVEGRVRYKGGYVTDPGETGSKNNFAHEGPGGYRSEVLPARLPLDLDALQARLGPIDLDPEASEAAPLAMTEAESAPYSPELDAKIPVGAVIPGVLLNPEAGVEGDRGHVRTAARWENGWWTLEVKRKLDTGSEKDVAFVPGESVYLWVTVFDHSQTRHSRHMRPFEIRIPRRPGA